MINLEVTLTQFQCRKQQFEKCSQQMIIFRFGSIKMEIKIYQNAGGYVGGKKIILNLQPEQLLQMFANFALGLFIQNRNGKFFSILSLQKLCIQDIISGQEIYFYNDLQQIVYSGNLSLIFTAFKNPSLPKKQNIQNHKTFQQLFKKPSIPKNQVNSKTINNFLNGTHKAQKQHEKTVAKPVNKKKTAINNKKATNGAISEQSAPSLQGWNKKKQGFEHFAATSGNMYINNQFNQDQQDDNPPMMQFTNIEKKQLKNVVSLKNQLQNLNATAPQIMKFQTTSNNKNQLTSKQFNFLKPKTNMVQKIEEKLNINQTFNETKAAQSIDSFIINRQQLKKKAKKELQSYQGDKNIQIPIFKDGKYQFLQLANLSKEEIVKYAKKQKQLQEQQRKKKQIEKQLLNQEKQNKILKNQLQQKQKILRKQQEQKKLQKLELLKVKKSIENQPKSNPTYLKPSHQKIQQQFSSDEYDQEKQKQDEYDYQNEEINEKQRTQNYESDFEQISLASGQKRSKISINQNKKGQQSQSYNDSYDPDFQSFSQSLLESNKKLSMSQISQSFRSSSKKH